MRRIFIVFAKLLGLLQLFWMISSSYYLLVSVGMLTRHERTGEEQITLAIVGAVLYLVVSTSFAVLLLFMTDRLANWLRIPADSEVPSVEPFSLILIGTKLIGLYMVVQGIPSLVKACVQWLNLWHPQWFIWQQLNPLIPPVVQIVLGLLLLLMTQKIVGWITRDWKPAEQ